MDPLGILLVDAGSPGQGTLGQGADGNQTLDDCMGIFTAVANGTLKSLVAVGLSLHGVIVVPGKHTAFESSNKLRALASSSNILDWN